MAEKPKCNNSGRQIQTTLFDIRTVLAQISFIFGPSVTPDTLREETNNYLRYVTVELDWRCKKIPRPLSEKIKGAKHSSGGYNGERDLVFTYALFRIAFILISPWWRDLISILQERPLERQDRLGWRDEHGLYPLFYLRDAHELLNWRSGIPDGPVRILEPGEILAFSKKSQDLLNEVKIRKGAHPCFRIHSHLFVEIDPMVPIEVLREELEELKSRVLEYQVNIKGQEEDESLETGGPPEYRQWDHRRINNTRPVVRSLLGYGISIIDAYRLKRHYPSKPHRTRRTKIDTPTETENKRVQRRIMVAEFYIEAALFGDFPPHTTLKV